MRIWLAAVAVSSAAWSVPAWADRDPLSGAPLPPGPADLANPITDHFYALGALYAPSVKTNLRVDPANAAPGATGTPLNAERDLGLPEHLNKGRAEFMFRLAERSKVRLDYFEADRSASHTLAKTIVFADQTFAQGSLADSALDWRMFGLTYTYSFFRTNRFELGSGLGAYFLQIDARGAVPAQGQSKEVSAAGPFPTLPLDFSLLLTRRLAFTARVNYLKATLTHFSGWVASSHEDLQYRCNRNFSLGVGYSSMRISTTGSSNNFTGTFYMSYNGPEAFLRFSF